MIDPILRKMILNWVYEEVISYTHNEEKADKICAATDKSLEDFREGMPLAQFVNSRFHQVFYFLDSYYGIEVDYYHPDIDEEYERVMMKWKAIKQGVDSDLVDILDI